jgi:hypothetical protein
MTRATALPVLALLLAACTATSPSPTPLASGIVRSPDLTPVPTQASTPTPTDDLVATAPPQAIPAQTDTEWGRIWDELPVGFPTGSVGPVSQVEPDEPASGAFDVPAPVVDVGAGMQAALESAGFSTFSMSGPFEDGSVVIESVGPGTTECLVQTTIAPLGEGSRITILYGAACPFPLE